MEIVVPPDGTGIFLRRDKDGMGDLSTAGIKIIWNFAASNLTRRDEVKVKALGIEMAYVAEGAFWVGDGFKSNGRLFEGGDGYDPENPKP